MFWMRFENTVGRFIFGFENDLIGFKNLHNLETGQNVGLYFLISSFFIIWGLLFAWKFLWPSIFLNQHKLCIIYLNFI